MKKIPTPVAVACLVGVILVTVFMLFRSAGKATGSDSGDPKTLVEEINKTNPKGDLPAGINPTAGAVGMGGGRGKK